MEKALDKSVRVCYTIIAIFKSVPRCRQDWGNSRRAHRTGCGGVALRVCQSCRRQDFLLPPGDVRVTARRCFADVLPMLWSITEKEWNRMKPRTQIMDEATLRRTMARITHEVLERNQGVRDLCVLGVKRRGVPLARMLCDNIRRFEGAEVPLGFLDVTLRRDDLSERDKQALATGSTVPFDLHDKTVVLVDDVLYTGRTAKAALETVFGFGRPRAVQLVVLIDRGHRELPIRPDYVGKNVPTSRSETIAVRLEEIDGETAVYICDA